MRRWTGSALVQVMACRLSGAKPLPEPMLQNCQLDHWEQTFLKFESKYKTFHSWKCIWNSHLWNDGHFVMDFFYLLTFLVMKPEYSERSRSIPWLLMCSLCRQSISNHFINKIPTTCTISKFRNVNKLKYIIMLPQNISASQRVNIPDKWFFLNGGTGSALNTSSGDQRHNKGSNDLYILYENFRCWGEEDLMSIFPLSLKWVSARKTGVTSFSH